MKMQIWHVLDLTLTGSRQRIQHTIQHPIRLIQVCIRQLIRRHSLLRSRRSAEPGKCDKHRINGLILLQCLFEIERSDTAHFSFCYARYMMKMQILMCGWFDFDRRPTSNPTSNPTYNPTSRPSNKPETTSDHPTSQPTTRPTKHSR